MTLKALNHIVIGMSGGVDSSVTAYLLKQAGHHVEGVFMKNWEGDDADTDCPAARDLADAQAVCDQLEINLHLINFADAYWQQVFSHFLQAYQAGHTPNPDVLCNKEIKFRAFLNYAKQLGADYIATGHYAQILPNKNDFYLAKGSDPLKDQSYFLYLLEQNQLKQTLFPLGALHKIQVRAIARDLKLSNHAKKDSTGICFIGEKKFKTFLQAYLPARPGKIETSEGEVIGDHDGLMFYTIGQRQGLKIGGQKGKADQAWYVCDKKMSRNVLVVVQGEQHPHLLKKTLTTSAIHWINVPPALPCTVKAKIRYRQTDQTCLLEKITEERKCHPKKEHYQISFRDPQRAVTPGQSIVFYKDHICLGGGIIEE